LSRSKEFVMPGFEALLRADVPGIHVLLALGKKHVDGQDEARP
jgi:hypothetical protein